MKTAVLLVNLGTPQSPQKRKVFSYLNEFLTDKRVIDLPWLKRQLLVRGVIVPFRTKQSAALYRSIWTEAGSPLLIHSLMMQTKLQSELGDDYRVFLAMRYQKPSLIDVLDQINAEGVEKLIILPLFPQYASATTGSIFQKVMEIIKSWQVMPKLVFLSDFYNHPKFIEALCSRGREHDIASYDHILFSFHGLPLEQIKKAYPKGKCLSKECCSQVCRQNRYCYKAQCYSTAHAIANKLSLKAEQYSICFQSRLGKAPWIQPYTSDILQHCAQMKRKKLLVFSPSFVCDCLETISEIGEEYLHEFKKMGGEKLQLVEGLNSHPKWISALSDIVKEG